MRPSGRLPDQLRKITITRNYTKHAEGSVLIECGDTRVLCTASVEDRVPGFLKGKGSGWVTAEYGMLPRSTGDRMRREAAAGGQGGRTMEIQRLIGRALRASVDLEKLGPRTVTLDCDVIQADGGTRTAAISGAFVALSQALAGLRQAGAIENNPIVGNVASVSVGIYDGTPVLDLDGWIDVVMEEIARDTGAGGLLDQLLAFRASAQGGGLSSKVVLLEDVEDEFNHGNPGPGAIKNFLAWVLSDVEGEGRREDDGRQAEGEDRERLPAHVLSS